ncbi:hypothetical protein BXY70_1343 [Roseovarius halotolerans]|uniref:Uncharacterized protein n=1 Tax=Roseovarius halotolerans TaxID=505353 RepID=A0A1X6Y563_9RHOB|nr:hypothetical protein [Roseovarius halotolerans]RKT35310.1 hypothetical protein BXY70_1343 [Roseovarius halotolerans]SLN11045.1 hypothetical protein ROH8110_00053 [Roseovarius halotolerans]
MRLRDLFFLHEIMPLDEWRDLGIAVVDYELAILEREEAVEKLTRANTELEIAESAVSIKKTQYGVGP